MMRLVTIMLSLLTLFDRPEVEVRWQRKRDATVMLRVNGLSDEMESCLASGLALRYRFEFQYCERRDAWIDRCGDEQVLHHALSFDPISEHYHLEVDQIGDTLPGEEVTFATREEAVEAFAQLSPIELRQITRGAPIADTQWSPPPRSYVSARVVADCRGEYSKFFTKLSSVLTLGLVSINYFDTGWVEYRFDP